MAIIVAAKSSTAAVAPKPSEKKAPPIAVVPHEFGIHGNNYKGAYLFVVVLLIIVDSLLILNINLSFCY